MNKGLKNYTKQKDRFGAALRGGQAGLFFVPIRRRQIQTIPPR